jgi:hypothetical protein
MRLEDIRGLLRRQPFRPFRLVLSNNMAHEIRHRDFVTLTRSVLEIGTVSNAEDGAATRVIGVALIHIVQYELLPDVESLA